LQKLVFMLDVSAKKLAKVASQLKAVDVGLAAEAAGQTSNAWLRFVLFVVSHVVVHHDPFAFWQNVAAYFSKPRDSAHKSFGAYVFVIAVWCLMVLCGAGVRLSVLWALRQRGGRGP
jgi:hypothetical protein